MTTNSGEIAILISDLDPGFLETSRQWFVQRGCSCDITTTSSGAQAAMKSRAYDVFIANIDVEGAQDLLLDWRCCHPATTLVVITERATAETAVQALRLGALDYVVKPVHLQQFWGPIRQSMVWKIFFQAVQELRCNREKLLGRVEAAAALAGSLAARGRPPQAVVSAAAAAQLALDEVIGSLTRLRATLTRLPGGTDPRNLPEPPRTVIPMEEALRETVVVLRQTKNAFRSKTLANLRKRLEAVLASQTDRIAS